MKGIKISMIQQLIGPDGKVKKEINIPCHTFLENFSQLIWLAVFMRGDAFNSATFTDTGGTNRTLRAPYGSTGPFDYTAHVNYRMKCRIGTGTAAYDRDDYDVETYLAELVYSQYTVTDDGTNKKLTLSFSWLNNTGSSKDVSEACLCCHYQEFVGPLYKFAITRDVFSPITVPDNYTLAIGYQITFPW